MKKVIIARSNGIDPDSRVEKEANSLSRNGYDVSLIAWDRSSTHKTEVNEKILSEHAVKRISIGSRAEFGAGMKSLGAFIRFQLKLFFWLVKHRKEYDICHFCDFDTAFTGSIASRILRKKFIFDIFDYLSTDAVSLTGKIIKKLEDSIIDRADAVIICTEQRKKQIASSRPKRLAVVHNSPERIDFRTDKYALDPDRIKICYVGILQDHRLLKEMVSCISQMPDCELHIGGFGKYEAYMAEAAGANSNIFFYGKLQYQDTLALESSCDIMTAIYDPAIGNHRYAAPNKFYESLMLGKPVLMVKKTGTAEIVEKYNIGEVIEYSESSFRQGLERLIERKFEWQIISDRMKHLYNENYSWKKMERVLIEVYKELDIYER